MSLSVLAFFSLGVSESYRLRTEDRKTERRLPFLLTTDNRFMSSRRPERVRGLLQETVAEILLREVKDPRIEGITLTGVDITPDLKLAKIYFSTLQPENHEAALVGLKSAAGYIKRQIAIRLQLRHTPELRFLYDTTLEKANRLESLLRQVEQEKR